VPDQARPVDGPLELTLPAASGNLLVIQQRPAK
jgi:hypothetical protein